MQKPQQFHLKSEKGREIALTRTLSSANQEALLRNEGPVAQFRGPKKFGGQMIGGVIWGILTRFYSLNGGTHHARV